MTVRLGVPHQICCSATHVNFTVLGLGPTALRPWLQAPSLRPPSISPTPTWLRSKGIWPLTMYHVRYYCTLGVLLCLFLDSISLLLAFIPAPLPGKPQILSGESLDRRQQNVELRPRLAPGSYRDDTRTKFENVSPTWRGTVSSTGNTVAVVLNRSRFENAYLSCVHRSWVRSSNAS